MVAFESIFEVEIDIFTKLISFPCTSQFWCPIFFSCTWLIIRDGLFPSPCGYSFSTQAAVEPIDQPFVVDKSSYRLIPYSVLRTLLPSYVR